MRMVASDLDGTIVRSDYSMSPRTLAALDACLAGGVEVVFVTGRPPRWMAPVAELTGHRGLAVCANGALLYDLVTETAVEARTLGAATVLAAADAVRAVMPDATFALEALDGFRREPGFMPRHEVARTAPAGSLDELLSSGTQVVKVLCRAPDRSADDMLTLARPVLAGLAEVVHSDPASSMLEVSAPGVSKASMLADLASRRGIAAADVVAFGDMPNDVAMLRWAGVGYAMTGGHPEAIAAADALAPPCEQDGVAQVLESLLHRDGGRSGPPRPDEGSGAGPDVS